MAEDLRFTAELMDAMSAPLNAIAEALTKVADSMNAATKVFQDGFDASVKASEALQASMDTLGKQVDGASQNISSASKAVTDELIPSLDAVSSTLVTVDVSLGKLTTGLADNTSAIDSNSGSLADLEIVQQQMLPQVNALAINTGALADQMYQNVIATDDLIDTNLALDQTQNRLVGNTSLLRGEIDNLSGRLADNSAAVQLDTDAVSALTPKVIDLTTISATAASNVGDLTVALGDQTKATTDATAAELLNTDATVLNTDAITKQAAVTSGATNITNNYASAQRGAASANTQADAAGTAGEGKRKEGYGAILGATMLLGMAGAAVRVGVNLVKMGMDGETALTHVAALTGASKDQMEQYKQSMEQLAVTSGKTISDLSGGLYDVISVGYQGADALKVLKASAYAAAAGGTDLHTVTNGLTGIMRAFGMTADQASHATDVLIKGVQLGKAPFDQFSRAIGLVGLVSHEAGFKIEETTSALSTLTQVYPSVRQAGQNLQNLIQTVGIGYSDVEKRVKATGKAFDENKFEAEGLQGRLQMLWEVAGGNAAVFKKLLGNATAAKAGYELVAGGAQQFTDNLNAMKHASDGAGVTMQAFQEHLQTMQAHIDSMKGALSVLALHFAAVAAPVITAALTALTRVFSGLATFIEKHLQIATPIIIALAGAVGGLLIGAIVALTRILIPMMAEAVGIAAPFVLAGLAIAGFAQFLKHAYDTSQPFHDAVMQVWGAMHELGTVVGQLVSPYIAAIVVHIKALVSGLGNLFGHTEMVSQTFFRWETVTKNVNGHLVTVHQRVEDVRQVLGHVRGPLSFVVDAIRHFAEAIHSLADKVRSLLPHVQHVQVVASNLANGISNLHTKFMPLENVIETTTKAASKHGDVFKHVWDIIKQVGGVLLSVIGPFGMLGTVMSVVGFLKGPAVLHMVMFVMAALKKLEPVLHGVSEVMGIFGKALAVGKATGDPFGMILKVIIALLRGGLMAAISGVVSAFMAWLPVILTIIGVVSAVIVVIVAVVYAVQHWWKTSELFHAILKAVVASLLDLWKTIQAQLHPVIVQLQDTIKNQLLPAWKNIQQAFEAAKPLLLVIAGVIGGILVVAFGILMGLLKGLVLGISMLLVGAIRFVGGIVQAFSGFILFVSSWYGGIVKILDDLIHGHFERIPGDILKMFAGVAKGVQQIFAGLWNAIQGLVVGLGGGILNFLGGFVTGFIGFFQHIFDKLVGHSIIPDLVTKIIFHIAMLPIKIAEHLVQLVAKFLGILGGLLGSGPKLMGNIVHGIAGAASGLVTGALPHLAKFAGDGLKHLGTLEVQGIQHGIKFATGVVTNVANMEVNGLKHIGTLAQNGLSIFNNLADQMSGKAKVMKDKVVLEHLQMQAGSLAHVANMNQREVSQLEQMRAHILDEMAHTKDGAKKHALEMQLGVVNQSIQMHQNAANEALHQKNDVMKHINEMKVKTQQDAHDMNTNVVSQAIQMGQNFVNNVASMAGNVGGKIKNMADDIVRKITDIGGRMRQAGVNLIQSLIDGIGSMVGNIANAAGNIAKTIGDHLHFGSPTKKGEGKTVMEWMPNLIGQLANDLAHGEQKVGVSAAKLAASIRKQIVQGTGNGAGVGVGLGGGGGLIGVGNGNVPQKQEVHLHLDGGLGAGLQLLNPTDRKRFARQIAEEMGRSMGMQGRLDNGYSGF